MRERLLEERLITSALDAAALTAGQFVEVTMRLQKSSLIESLETLRSVMRLAVIFEDGPTDDPASKGKGRPAGRRTENQKMLEQMDELFGELTTGQTADLVGEPVNGDGVTVVLTLDTAFAGDASLSDLVDGEYAVLGKVTRVIPSGSDETINLLRKTSLGKLQSALLDQLKGPLSDIQHAGLALPEFRTEIEGPVLQILPIAVFA